MTRSPTNVANSKEPKKGSGFRKHPVCQQKRYFCVCEKIKNMCLTTSISPFCRIDKLDCLILSIIQSTTKHQKLARICHKKYHLYARFLGKAIFLFTFAKAECVVSWASPVKAHVVPLAVHILIERPAVFMVQAGHAPASLVIPL